MSIAMIIESRGYECIGYEGQRLRSSVRETCVS